MAKTAAMKLIELMILKQDIDKVLEFLGKRGNFQFQNLPKEYNVVFGGHTHVSGITNYDGTVYVNPGSLSIPKGGTTNGYAKIEGTKISLHNLQGETLHEIVL